MGARPGAAMLIRILPARAATPGVLTEGRHPQAALRGSGSPGTFPGALQGVAHQTLSFAIPGATPLGPSQGIPEIKGPPRRQLRAIQGRPVRNKGVLTGKAALQGAVKATHNTQEPFRATAGVGPDQGSSNLQGSSQRGQRPQGPHRRRRHPQRHVSEARPDALWDLPRFKWGCSHRGLTRGGTNLRDPPRSSSDPGVLTETAPQGPVGAAALRTIQNAVVTSGSQLPCAGLGIGRLGGLCGHNRTWEASGVAAAPGRPLGSLWEAQGSPPLPGGPLGVAAAPGRPLGPEVPESTPTDAVDWGGPVGASTLRGAQDAPLGPASGVAGAHGKALGDTDMRGRAPGAVVVAPFTKNGNVTCSHHCPSHFSIIAS
ncbi:collagen alpha-1(XVII) chain-like [Homarus americanus]|uniref:collagen alpha-1(XVII) chain-like n=1 Tax=Homarus americanus TaxID=6706 RepID=UPI001C48CEBA|nr:collagen alpha-1(XVII) chain-like [Homarus americanus]